MLITDKILEQYKENPYKMSYDSGYSTGGIDAWNEEHPKAFNKTDNRAYRDGYRHGWAEQKAHIRAETIDSSIYMSEHIFNGMVEKELERVTAETNVLAECPDSECEEYNNDWLKVIDLLERQNSGDTEGVIKRVTKDGVVYDRDKL